MKICQSFIWGWLVFILFCSTAKAEILFIANKSVEQTSIQKDNTQMVFLGTVKKWENGKKIYLAVLKKGTVHEEFLNAYVKKNSDKFSSYWKMKTVAGTGYPPKKFKTEEELVSYVAGKEGAIGYISVDTPHESVNILYVK